MMSGVYATPSVVQPELIRSDAGWRIWDFPPVCAFRCFYRTPLIKIAIIRKGIPIMGFHIITAPTNFDTKPIRAKKVESMQTDVDTRTLPMLKRGWHLKWSKRKATKGTVHTLFGYNSKGAQQFQIAVFEGAAADVPVKKEADKPAPKVAKKAAPKKTELVKAKKATAAGAKSTKGKKKPAQKKSEQPKGKQVDEKKAAPKKIKTLKPNAAQKEWVDYLPDMREAINDGEFDFILDALHEVLTERKRALNGVGGSKPTGDHFDLIEAAKKAQPQIDNYDEWVFGVMRKDVKSKSSGLWAKKGDFVLIDPTKYDNRGRTYVTIFSPRRGKNVSVIRSFVSKV